MAAAIHISHQKTSITIKAHLLLYGTFASDELGQRIVNEINSMWNEPKAKILVNESDFEVWVEVDFECLSQADILYKVQTNTNFENNFIRIEEKNIAQRSMMGFGLGDNSGHWLITDQLGDSTTASHEFGHALGLPHPDRLDYRNTGMPPIMAPRGTIVDTEYQWNPLAEPGAIGGTMRPIFRRVRADEVIKTIQHLDFSQTETQNIGRLSNQLFDEIGRPVALRRDINT
jgi:hypothetical protein